MTQLPKLPEQFVQMISTMELPALQALPKALDTPATTAVRVNALKGMCLPEGADVVAWCRTGCYLSSRPAFTLDPAMHQGLYYVQEASSMIQYLAVSHAGALIAAGGVTRPLTMLDACAAPGGKTTCAIEALPQGSVMVANELDPRRADVLVENIVKHGSPGVIVTRGNATAFEAAGPMFDIIAVDAPCSGEGMMRKEPVARQQWSPGLVEQCAAVQRDITQSLWHALRPGGYMIYSTCTFNRSEDEAVVEKLVAELGAEPVAIPVDEAWSIAPGVPPTQLPCLRFIPGYTRGEGLFMALLHKPGQLPAETQTAGPRRAKGRQRQAAPAIPAMPEWLAGDQWVWTSDTQRQQLYAAPPAVESVAQELGRVTSVIHKGVAAATLKGPKAVPAQGLAMSTALAPGAFSTCEVDRPTALAYLRREAVTLSEDAPRGYVLLTHGGHPLGFVNNLGNRSNNLYPPQWRIRTTHLQ